MKDRSFTMYAGFFDMTITVIVSDNLQRAYNRRKKVMGPVNPSFGWDKVLGGVYERGRMVWVMLLRTPNIKALRHDVIAHEISHLVDHALTYNGIEWGPGKCKETKAMATEYFTRCIYHHLRIWKQKTI